MKETQHLGFGIISAVLISSQLSLGSIEVTQSVQASAGVRATGGAFTNVATVGQPINSVSRNGLLVNQAGFIQSLSLNPALDHDLDGLNDEIDLDNDNDSIEDLAELRGTTFAPAISTDPNNADTDSDGLDDGAEWMADTSPTNSSSLLGFSDIRKQGDGIRVVWVGGIVATQFLARSESLTIPPQNWEIIFTNHPPTATTTNFVDSATNRPFFYMIRVERP